MQLKTTKKGDRFALLRLEDEAGGTKCVLWPETFRKYSALLQNENPALITGRLELTEDGPPSIIADQVQNLDNLLQGSTCLVLRLPASEDSEGLFDTILHLLNTHSGSCEITLELLIDSDVLVRVKPNSQLRIGRCDELDVALKKLGCLLRSERASQTGV